MARLENDKAKMQKDVQPSFFRESSIKEDFLCFLAAIVGVIVLMYLYSIVEFFL